MDLEFARRAAEKAKAKQDAARIAFEEQREADRAFAFSAAAWQEWPSTWENITLHRKGHLAGQAGERELAAVLESLLKAVQVQDQSENLRLAAERFDPSYCDDTEYEEEAGAVRILLDALVDIASGTDATVVAQALLSLDPLPLLHRADSASRLIQIAERWPLHCEQCRRIQPPGSFGYGRCRDCKSVYGKLGSLVQHLICVDQHGEEGLGKTTDLFPFWSEWRLALQIAFPGVESDLQLWRLWTHYLHTKHGIENRAWNVLSFDDAAPLLPPPAVAAIEVAPDCADKVPEGPKQATPSADEPPAVPRRPGNEALIEELERNTPPLHPESVEWLAARKENAKELGLPLETLRSYRTGAYGGRRMPNKMFGIDRNGRKWRRQGTPGSTVYYYVPSLPKTVE